VQQERLAAAFHDSDDSVDDRGVVDASGALDDGPPG
jgi:hypothetical protein